MIIPCILSAQLMSITLHDFVAYISAERRPFILVPNTGTGTGTLHTGTFILICCHNSRWTFLVMECPQCTRIKRLDC